MPEKVSEILKKLADILHWMGKYQECNILIYLLRWVKLRKLETLDELKAYVEMKERESHDRKDLRVVHVFKPSMADIERTDGFKVDFEVNMAFELFEQHLKRLCENREIVRYEIEDIYPKSKEEQWPCIVKVEVAMNHGIGGETFYVKLTPSSLSSEDGERFIRKYLVGR